jgi:O-antigen/teichoic acid export membrane protein
MADFPASIDSREVAVVSQPTLNDSPDSLAAATQNFRSHVGHISRHSGVFFAGTLFTTALSYVFKVYLARVLGAEELGLYALGLTLVGFLGIFNSLGLPQSAVRFVASYQVAGKFRELHALLWQGAAVLLGANVVVAVVLLTLGRVIAVRFYHSPALVRYLPLFALMMLLGLISGFYGKVLAGYRDIKLRTWIVNFIGSPLNMLAAVILISGGFGLGGYISAQVIASAIVCLMLVVAVSRLTPKAARLFSQPFSSPPREIWSFSAAMLGIGFLEFLVSQVHKVVLGYYRGPREVGIYSVAAALVAYVPLALGSINQIFAPTIADLHTRGDLTLLGRLFQSLTKWAISITLPLAIVVMVFAHPLMRIFGRDFEAGWPILVIGTLGQLVNCAVGSVGYLLLMSGNEKRLIKVEIVVAALTILASVALIPVLGAIGAAAAAAISNVGLNVLNLIQVRKALGLSPYNRSYLRLLFPTLATVVSSVVLYRFAFIFHHDWIAVGATLAVAYGLFAAVVLMLGLDADDRLIASAIWSRMRATFLRVGEAAW